ncbi:hypothetical protein BBJ29_001543 [Phytophthora kernoviae]|uniref:Uncharacterized protein n=1 Tax=Phytophthora kernoviae TaxID=325452 RepID=A0A3F2RXK4_9STRA|nr:hypothetical protein BBJ29_001543 [Phytophthora kernoviae]RLN66203.1 hypothetical protein BBP00_00002353 [Phytophthora kernoviae]
MAALATRGGKTSIGVLLDWLTAPGNYSRWRDGKQQSGESREMLCSEIKGNMHRQGIHHRENANIRTQISELERAFENARDWLDKNGYDPVTFESKPDAEVEDPELGVNADRQLVETHILRSCRYYHVLSDVFGQNIRSRRPYHRNATPVVKKRKYEDDGGAAADVAEDIIVSESTEEEVTRVPLGLPSVAAATVQVSTSTPPTAVSAAASAAAAAAQTVVSGASPRLTGTWTNPAALANYESTQRLLAEAVREERERKRFAMEEERNKLECEKLRYEVEAAKLQLKMDRALARRKLLDAGLPETQVDEVFPN